MRQKMEVNLANTVFRLADFTEIQPQIYIYIYSRMRWDVDHE